jgi:hypothetical protein
MAGRAARARAQQFVIRHVGKQILVQALVVGQAIDRFYPHVFDGREFLGLQKVHWPDGPELERALVGQVAPHLLRNHLQYLR